MQTINNSTFTLEISDEGNVSGMRFNGDLEQMNWVIDPSYLSKAGYPDEDKLFGRFDIRVNGKDYSSTRLVSPIPMKSSDNRLDLVYVYGHFEVAVVYDLEGEDGLSWRIAVRNIGKDTVSIEDFGIWASVAYVMFKDPNLNRNIAHSCAVFPSISEHFSKLACVRRSNRGPHLGIYAVNGPTRSVGTFCRFENLFFHNVSPSLDGLLYHRLILAGRGSTEPSSWEADWVYGGNADPILIGEGESAEWEYRFLPFDNREHFYARAGELGHPVWEYPPVAVEGGEFEASVKLPDSGRRPEVIWLEERDGDRAVRTEVTASLGPDGRIRFPAGRPGEKKLSVRLEGGRTDSIVFNVSVPMRDIVEARADYICSRLYTGANSDTPHAFLPISNQGESLGKAVFILMKNAVGGKDREQIRKVENSAVHYIRPKWFEGGDFLHPAKLYGDFYRIIDFDYIAHIYYLLSRLSSEDLTFHSPREYLKWAAEAMIIRMDARLHEEEREQKETEMLGVYILFIEELLRDLDRTGLRDESERLSGLWKATGERLRAESAAYLGAVTEHYYDNAGFGPTFEALCRTGHLAEAARYGELLIANIGFSNDFRAQNPDRWWEALSYMIHSLWGGLTAASALTGYETFRQKEYLLTAYRSTMAVFYCYDWNATATRLKLGKGEAASTYSVAGPHLNRPDLSRNRFGQSTFNERDGEIFKGLFQEDSGYDWDMGEELAAYLAGFGTKTYLYRDSAGTLRCVNGEIVREGDRYRITSFAAYPREFHCYEENASYCCADGEEVRTVYYDEGRFYVE